jgi:hypothetical protein
MLGGGLPGQLAAFGAASALTPAQVSALSAMATTSNVTTSRSLTSADNGADFTNVGAAAAVVLTVPSGLAIGTTFEISQTALFDIGFAFSGGETVKVGTAAGVTTLTAISNGGTTTGSTFRIKKESATVWFLKFFEGSVG